MKFSDFNFQFNVVGEVNFLIREFAWSELLSLPPPQWQLAISW